MWRADDGLVNPGVKTVSRTALSRIASALLLLVLILALPRPAYAYLDPGAGSMLLQVILGGIAGLAVGVRLFWHRILGFFSRQPPTPPAGASTPPESGDSGRP